ncbi:hypothetical protein LTR10_023299 [Elasticomyces elasticus]|nr:hypothetical protein LTR10_023299 [Elasticomyces elasticus]
MLHNAQPVEDGLKITAGEVSENFDAVATDDLLLAEELFKATKEIEEFVVRTNDWSGIVDLGGGKTYSMAVGAVDKHEAKKLNENIEKFTPVIVGLFAAGR